MIKKNRNNLVLLMKYILSEIKGQIFNIFNKYQILAWKFISKNNLAYLKEKKS